MEIVEILSFQNECSTNNTFERQQIVSITSRNLSNGWNDRRENVCIYAILELN